MNKRVLSALFAMIVLISLCPAVRADGAVTEIDSPEDLCAMADDPSGSYILTADIDMAGIQWKSLDFSGSFDGNGHAILNLTVTQPGDRTEPAYDGNKIGYDTVFAGFFGVLENAEVKNLQLLNVRGCIETDEPCFFAGMAGCCLNSTISGCTVTGTLELRAHDRSFGIGGIVGYGYGSITRCNVDMTLICVDTDAATRDEQFLGGLCASGFFDITDCTVSLDGYVSEHGYVHCGGGIGMAMDYPYGMYRKCYFTGNSVTGKITFFEDNTSRRAYCEAFIGEILVSWVIQQDNRQDFVRDERRVYDRELRPETCENPVYTETVIAPGCAAFGWTESTCQTCGYRFNDCYTLPAHSVTQWTQALAATVESEGLLTGLCDGCDMEFTQITARLEPEPTTVPESTPEATEAHTAAPEPEAAPSVPLWPILTASAALAAVIGPVLQMRRRKHK